MFVKRKREKTQKLVEAEKKKKVRLSKEQKKRKKRIRICKRALLSFPCSWFFWFCFLCFLAFAMYMGISKNFFKFTKAEKTAKETFSFCALVILMIVCFIRIAGSIGISKRLGPDRRDHVKHMPDNCTSVIRELYIVSGEKKCTHFWISFILTFLSILLGAYVAVVAGVGKWAGADYKLFNKEEIKSNFLTLEIYSKIDSMDWSQFLALASAGCTIFFPFQYWLTSWRNKRVMSAIEYAYGKEKMVDECLYIYRINRLHTRYKIFAFMLLCLLGIGFFFFIKKLIAVVFDKSFSL